MQPPLLRLRPLLLRRVRRPLLRSGRRRRGGRRWRWRRRRRREGGGVGVDGGRAVGRRRDHAHNLSVNLSVMD